MIPVVVGIFLAGQAIADYVLSPYLIASRVQLNPVWMMFAIAAFGYLFGFVGLLIAVPLAAAIGVVIRFAIRQHLVTPPEAANTPPPVSPARASPPPRKNWLKCCSRSDQCLERVFRSPPVVKHKEHDNHREQHKGQQKDQQRTLLEPSDDGNAKSQDDSDHANTPGGNMDARRERPQRQHDQHHEGTGDLAHHLFHVRDEHEIHREDDRRPVKGL